MNLKTKIPVFSSICLLIIAIYFQNCAVGGESGSLNNISSSSNGSSGSTTTGTDGSTSGSDTGASTGSTTTGSTSTGSTTSGTTTGALPPKPKCNSASGYYSDNAADLNTYGQYVLGGCYIGTEAAVDSRCIRSSPSGTNQGTWNARNHGNDPDGGPHGVCNHDNLCYGCYMGTDDDSRIQERTCTRRYYCDP